MASYAFDQFKKSQQLVTHSFTLAPLYCAGCLKRLQTGLTRNGINATCEVTRYGNRDGDQSGDFNLTVDKSVSHAQLLEILTKKMGLKFPDARSGGPSIGF